MFVTKAIAHNHSLEALPIRARILAVFGLAGVFLLILAGCAGPAIAEAPTEPEVASDVEVPAEQEVAAEAEAPVEQETVAEADTAAPPEFTISISADAIDIPDGIPAGLVAIAIDNTDQEWHAAIIRRLNEGVSVEDFTTAFETNPLTTFPMTHFVGGPDIPGETIILGYYSLTSGTYIVVDNWNEPWRFTTFEVAGEAVQAEPPEADIPVTLNEYNIEMPESVSSGSHLWQFTNEGDFPHNVGFIRLAEGVSTDDLATWMHEQQGPPPFEYFGMWNTVSPGVTSWGELELKPGDYMAVDMMPDFASENGWNVDQDMVQTFTVTP